ncbi:hypothetical protein SPHINGO391_450108 [Sphingomonas aurantiaca]|uniref:Uncharacterized protein n=1 Tax=Sphingomonas aurantiaca TaxID=185949 RepID=A0A5E7ZLT2_9SPHN|nr:hypothetical protein SPHINGO391_450108 [Sphingomonas aurantiaca]
MAGNECAHAENARARLERWRGTGRGQALEPTPSMLRGGAVLCEGGPAASRMDQVDELLVDRRAVQMKMHCVIALSPQPLTQRIDRLAFARPCQFECSLHRGNLSRHPVALSDIPTGRERSFVRHASLYNGCQV